MKKLILFSIVLCFVTSVSAQIRYGVKAGANFSNLYVSGDKQGFNANQYKGKFGYHFGGVMEYSLSNVFAIQPELMYLNHGANLKNDNSFGIKDGHVTLNTLQLPVNLKASFNVGSSDTKVFVYGGPYVGFNVYRKVAGQLDGVAVDNSLYSKSSDMKRWDYGVGIGVGVEVNKFVLTLGNQIGQQDISGAKIGKMKAGNISLSAGYFF